MTARILVTGAAGFIGSFVSRELVSRGYEVVGIDSISDYYSTQLKEVRLESLQDLDRFVFAKIDISSKSAVSGLFQNFKFDGVIHLAAQAGVRLPLGDAYRYVDSNILGFHNIFSNTLESEVRNFLYASSSSVYGDESPIPYTETSKLLSPKSFYGATKLTNELEAKHLGFGHNTSIRGVRFFTVYGPWGRPDMAYFRLMAAALGHHEFTLYGDGRVQRDFTFIDDVCQTTVDLYENLNSTTNKVNDIVNIGGQRPLSMNFLIDEVKRVSGNRIQIGIDVANISDSMTTMADNSFLTALIGKRSFTPLEQGISKFYSWMSQPHVEKYVGDWIKSSI